jgi:hypothetical protein
MQLHSNPVTFSYIRSFAALERCPYCADMMVAPVRSEFVDGGEIRHYWECDTCAESSCTSIPLAAD